MKISYFIAIGLVGLVASAAHADGYPKKKKKTNVQQQAYVEKATPVATPHNMAGCGLGSLAIQDQSKWSQVGASLLNATGFQSFAISFGTSNCTEDGVTQASREKEAFVESNYADLQHDVNLGSGEYLSSLASLYGCQGGNVSGFATAAKQSGAFSAENPDAAVLKLNQSLKSNSALLGACKG